MSIFAILLLALLTVYLSVGMAIFIVGTWPAKIFSQRRLLTRRCSRKTVAKGELFQVSLYVRGEGQPAPSSKMHRIVLVIDRSASMGSERMFDSPLGIARQSALEFVRRLSCRQNGIGVVQFDTTAQSVCEITDRQQVLKAAIGGIESGGGTDMLCGIQDAFRQIAYSRRQTSGSRSDEYQDIIIALTDGRSEHHEELGVYCNQLKSDEHVRIITIGLGEEVNTELLRDIASLRTDVALAGAGEDAEFYHVLKAENLVGVYGSLAEKIGSAVGYLGTIVERLNKRYFTYARFDEQNWPLRHDGAEEEVHWLQAAVFSAPTMIASHVKSTRVGWHRIAACAARFDYYALPGREHHVYPKFAEEDNSMGSVRETERCLSNRNPWILVTPDFGPPMIWTIVLNPLFWLFWNPIMRLFRNREIGSGPSLELVTPSIPSLSPIHTRVVQPSQTDSTQFRRTLVVGLGQSGRHILTLYKNFMCDSNDGRFPSDSVKLLQLDTDSRGECSKYSFAGSKLASDEVASLSTDLFDLHRDLLLNHPAHLRWYLSEDLAGMPREVFNTAGGTHRVRQVARLAFYDRLAWDDSELRTRLSEAALFLMEALKEGHPAQLIITGSASGGTGSAIVHDLAYILVRGLQEMLPEGRRFVETLALMLGHSCFRPHVSDKDIYHKNARSFLDEWGRLLTNLDLPLAIDYGVELGQILGFQRLADKSAPTEKAPIRDLATNLCDYPFMIDPVADSYTDKDGVAVATGLDDGHYPAVADLIAHLSIESADFRSFLFTEIQELNRARTRATQLAHFGNVYLRSVRFPVTLTRRWLKWRFACDWIVGRTLWAELKDDRYVPNVEIPAGRLGLEDLLRGGRHGEDVTPPVLHSSLETLAQEIGADWVESWKDAFASIEVDQGADAQQFVDQQTRQAYHWTIRWILLSLNGGITEIAPEDLDGALPRTISVLSAFQELINKTTTSFCNLPLSELSEDDSYYFPQWRAQAIEKILDRYSQMVDLLLEALTQWYHGLLGLRTLDNIRTESSVCQLVAEGLHCAERGLDDLASLHSVRFLTDSHFREGLYEKHLEGKLDEPGFRSRVRWTVDDKLRARLDAALSETGTAAVPEAAIRQLFLMVIYDGEDSQPKRFTDPIKQGAEITAAISALIDAVDEPRLYYSEFAREAGKLIESHLGKHDLIQVVMPGIQGNRRRLIAINSNGLAAQPGVQVFKNFELYHVPVVQSVVDLQVGIPVDKSASWDPETLPDRLNCLFPEEQHARLLSALILDQLGIRYSEFSPRTRQYLADFGRLQSFLYLYLKGDIRDVQHVLTRKLLLGWFESGKLKQYLTTGGNDLLDGLNRFMSLPEEKMRGFTIDREQMVHLIDEHKGELDLPEPTREEFAFILKLIRLSGGWIEMPW